MLLAGGRGTPVSIDYPGCKALFERRITDVRCMAHARKEVH